MKRFSLNIKGELLSLDNPLVMGILNVTTDSFYDGGKYLDEKNILQQVEKMLNDGATIIDVGAQSTRPNATLLSQEIELQKVLPIVKLICKEFPTAIISIDTFYSEVAAQCVLEGVAIINDISAGNIDANMFETVGKLKVPYILMHSRGTPQTMQNLTEYDNVVTDVYKYFTEKIALLKQFGVLDIIVDLGFGFAKTTENNFELLKCQSVFRGLGHPILTGISRKGMVYKTLDTTPENALNGTSVLNTIALQNGANILRVHDVKEAVEVIKLVSLCFL